MSTEHERLLSADRRPGERRPTHTGWNAMEASFFATGEALEGTTQEAEAQRLRRTNTVRIMRIRPRTKLGLLLSLVVGSATILGGIVWATAGASEPLELPTVALSAAKPNQPAPAVATPAPLGSRESPLPGRRPRRR